MMMADGFDSDAVELSNTKVQTDSENSRKLNVPIVHSDDESIKKEAEKQGSLRCSLKIEVIDDTAMIDISQLGGNKANFDDAKSSRRRRGGGGGGNSKKKNMGNHHHQEQKKEEKMVARTNSGKRVYSRKELENLRFVGMEEQKKMWTEVYCGLSDTVQKEYDGLRRHLGKENTPLFSGVLAAKERGKHMKVYTQRGMTYMNMQNTLCLPGH